LPAAQVAAARNAATGTPLRIEGRYYGPPNSKEME